MDSTTPLFRVGDYIILTHPYRGIPAGSAGKITALAGERERQAQALADFAATHPEPLIALGDFNATPASVAHTTMSRVLADSWIEAGWGPGHTFPGAASPGSSRPRIAGILVPQWLLRIDYVFHSHQWQTLGAWIGPWDAVSDHRSVVVRLAITVQRTTRNICAHRCKAALHDAHNSEVVIKD